MRRLIMVAAALVTLGLVSPAQAGGWGFSYHSGYGGYGHHHHYHHHPHYYAPPPVYYGGYYAPAPVIQYQYVHPAPPVIYGPPRTSLYIGF